jgi:hypothetical protein
MTSASGGSGHQTDLEPTVRGRWLPSRADAVTAFGVAFTRARRAAAVAAGLALLYVALLLSPLGETPHPLQTVLVVALGVVFLAMALAIHRILASVVWKRSAVREQCIEITERGARVFPGPAPTTFDWSVVTVATRRGELVVVVHRDEVGRTHVTAVPDRAFGTPEEVARFTDVVRRQVPRARV